MEIKKPRSVTLKKQFITVIQNRTSAKYIVADIAAKL